MTWLIVAAFWLLLGVVVGIFVGTYLRARDVFDIDSWDGYDPDVIYPREAPWARHGPYDWREEGL